MDCRQDEVEFREDEVEYWPDNYGPWMVQPSRFFKGVREAPQQFTITYGTKQPERIGFIDWAAEPLSDMAKKAHRRVLSHPQLKVVQNDVVQNDKGFVNCAAVSWMSSPTAWGAGTVLPNSNKECELCSLFRVDSFAAHHKSDYGLPFKGQFTPQELLKLYRAWAVVDFDKMTLFEVIKAMRDPRHAVGPNKRVRVS